MQGGIFTRSLWSICLIWPGAITIVDSLGYETDLALSAALTNTGYDMHEWSATYFGLPARWMFALFAGTIQLAAGIGVATGRMERAILCLALFYYAWLAFVCNSIALEGKAGEMRPAVTFAANNPASEVKATSSACHIFICSMILWRLRGLRRFATPPRDEVNVKQE